MKIWLYCSYSGSPTGFRLGYIEEEDPSATIIKGNPHKLLDRCFTYQGIAKAYGKIPGKNNYIYYRSVKRQKDDTIFINIGFETNIVAEYEHIFSYFEQFNTTHTYENRQRKEERIRSEEEDRLFQRLRPIIIENTDDLEFGIQVDRSKLVSLIEDINEFSCIEPPDEGFFLQSNSDIQEELFASNIHLTSILGEGYGLGLKTAEGDGENLFMVRQLPSTLNSMSSRSISESQKKTKLSGMFLTILLLFIVIVIVIMIWILSERK